MILIVLVILAIINSGNVQQLKAWNDARNPFTYAEFINHFAAQGYDEDIVICFYNSILKYGGLNFENANIYPQDRLTKEWLIDSEDLEFSIIPDLFKQLSIPFPSDEEIEQFRIAHNDLDWDAPEFLIGILQETRNRSAKP